MLSDEVTAALARFFETGSGPSHDELTRLIDRAGLGAVDPRRDDAIVGKMKRVRAVLWWAAENDGAAGSALVRSLLAALRAAGSFRPGEPNYAGESTITALREALGGVGFDLTDDGVVTARSMEGLSGASLTSALRAYVRRARSAGDDVALRIGTAKDLTEATARHVIVERGGAYPSHGHFMTTLWQAYDALDLVRPEQKHVDALLSGDPWASVERAAFVLACAVNRFRNAEGTGHGRPHESLAADEPGAYRSRSLCPRCRVAS